MRLCATGLWIFVSACGPPQPTVPCDPTVLVFTPEYDSYFGRPDPRYRLTEWANGPSTLVAAGSLLFRENVADDPASMELEWCWLRVTRTGSLCAGTLEIRASDPRNSRGLLLTQEPDTHRFRLRVSAFGEVREWPFFYRTCETPACRAHAERVVGHFDACS